MPLQRQDAPTPRHRMLGTLVRRSIPPRPRRVPGVSTWHHARAPWRTSAPALRSMVHGALHAPRVRLRWRRHGLPLGAERIHADVTCLVGTPTGDRPCGAVLVDDPTRPILLLPSHSRRPGLGVASGETTARRLADLHRRLTIDTPAFAASCCEGLRVFFCMVSQRASGSWLFFWGVALTTWPSRTPIRLRPAAMVLGEGHCSAPYPGARSASQAAWAVSLVSGTPGRKVGACCAWASAR